MLGSHGVEGAFNFEGASVPISALGDANDALHYTLSQQRAFVAAFSGLQMEKKLH